MEIRRAVTDIIEIPVSEFVIQRSIGDCGSSTRRQSKVDQAIQRKEVRKIRVEVSRKPPRSAVEVVVKCPFTARLTDLIDHTARPQIGYHPAAIGHVFANSLRFANRILQMPPREQCLADRSVVLMSCRHRNESGRRDRVLRNRPRKVRLRVLKCLRGLTRGENFWRRPLCPTVSCERTREAR